MGLLGHIDSLIKYGTFKGAPAHYAPTLFAENHDKLLSGNNDDNKIADFIIFIAHQSADSNHFLEKKNMSNIELKKKK